MKKEGAFVLDTDASNTGIGAVLSQTQGGEEKVIAYFSRSLTKAERRYCVTRKELLALVTRCEALPPLRVRAALQSAYRTWGPQVSDEL